MTEISRPKLTIAALLVLCSFTYRGQTSVLTGPVFNPANGHSYFLLDSASWTDSELEAIALSGHLVTINDAEENQWVFDTFAVLNGVTRDLWLGLSDAAMEGAFVWREETSDYRNWQIGQPDDGSRGTEEYVQM